MRVVDLSLALEPGIRVFEGDPQYSLTPALSVQDAGYAVSELRLSTHCGTHIDVPRHVLVDGADTFAFGLSAFVGEAAVVSASVEGGFAALDDAAFDAIPPGGIALIHTGWEDKAGEEDYLSDYPALRRRDVERLIAMKLTCVGTDLPSFETDLSCQIHRMLLRAGIGLAESLVNLGGLVGRRVMFSAAPLKMRGGDGSPVRAYAIVDE